MRPKATNRKRRNDNGRRCIEGPHVDCVSSAARQGAVWATPRVKLDGLREDKFIPVDLTGEAEPRGKLVISTIASEREKGCR